MYVYIACTLLITASVAMLAFTTKENYQETDTIIYDKNDD